MTIIATYRNGVFMPETAVSLPEGARVEVLLPDEARQRAEEVRAIFKARYPESIGAFTHEEAEELRRAVAELKVVDDESDC